MLFEELELVETHGTDVDTAPLWAPVEEVAPRSVVMSAAALVVSLVPEDEDSAEVAMRAALTNQYNTVRPFLALLGETSALGAAPAGPGYWLGVRRLPALARRRVKDKPLPTREADDKLVPPAWRKADTPTRRCTRGPWTGTRTWCACWSTGPFSAGTWPSQRSGGVLSVYG